VAAEPLWTALALVPVAFTFGFNNAAEQANRPASGSVGRVQTWRASHSLNSSVKYSSRIFLNSVEE
jgi:hypothetical protein